eukprot:gene4354-4607_t
MERADFSKLVYMEDSKTGNGSRYKVLTRAVEAGGAYYTVEILGRGSAPGFVLEFAASLPAHVHASQDEELVVKSGKLGYTRGGALRDRGVAGPGDTINIPKGTPHSLYNADNTTDVLYELTHRPAGALGEAFFENLAGLGWDHGSLDRIHPLQALVLHDAADTELTDLPSFLQPVVKHVLVPAAKLLGFKAQYPSHVSAATSATAAADADDVVGADELTSSTVEVLPESVATDAALVEERDEIASDQGAGDASREEL